MVQGFAKAQAEFERHLTAPYDEGGMLYDEEFEQEQRMEYLETQAEYQMENFFCGL